MGYFLVSLFFDQTVDVIIKYSSWHNTEAISPLYFTLLMVLYALSLTGAIRMWKFHRNGFWLYLFAQLAILFIPVVWTDWQAFSAANAIFTLVFITGYALNLKHFKKTKEPFSI
ncbi:hypothetical protein SAMN05444274_104198 [Mariniphaga anaerophila]|uniref:Uncharacterized protein n=2 Tax=Mariniphaga anaerophila TaxID=1484053 RepID=A0A1M5A5V9_9BACT|nr:hypothetical protein SAMN05444274_104198 [Mariniphaga anaerophila]